MSSSGDENVSNMTRTVHAYVASVNILVLMFVLTPVVISQVWTRLKFHFDLQHSRQHKYFSDKHEKLLGI